MVLTEVPEALENLRSNVERNHGAFLKAHGLSPGAQHGGVGSEKVGERSKKHKNGTGGRSGGSQEENGGGGGGEFVNKSASLATEAGCPGEQKSGDSLSTPSPLLARVSQLRWGDERDIASVASEHEDMCPFDMIVGTDVVYQAENVDPMFLTMHRLSHNGSVVWLCLQERCAAAHKRLLERAPLYFRDFACMDTHGLPGFEHGDELECKLYRLSGRLPEEELPG